VLSFKDNTYSDGKIGFWCNSPKSKSLFDDIVVTPVKIVTTVPEFLSYEFEIRQKAGFDFCDWENAGNIFKRKNYDGWTDHLVIEKKLFLEASMWNKKSFIGNIEINVDHRFIPQDVDVNIMFKAMGKGKYDEYKFTVSSDRIIVTKNNIGVLEKNIPVDRSSCSVEYNGKEWIFKTKDAVLFKYSDKIKYALMKIGLCYSGIGMGDVFFEGVNISSDMYYN
jgi:hypothetical protein